MSAALASAGISEAADATAFLRQQSKRPGGSTLPWYAAWRGAMDALTRCAQHEQWDCPVACITAVSSSAANPIAELNDLSGQHHLPPSFAAEVYDPDMPRVYVLVHDASVPGASTEQLRQAFQQVTQHFPRDVTFAVVVNSRWGQEQEVAADSTLWRDDVSVPLLFTPCRDTLLAAAAAQGLAAGDAAWPAAGQPHPAKGQWLSHADVQRLQTVGSDITLRVVLPGWGRKMSALFTNVASQKKGLRNALRSWLKRPKDASPRRSSRDGASAYTPAVYSYGSLETQTRLLADSLAMVGDVNGAATVYRWAADEYKAAGAGLHYAAATEALALCMLRTGGPSRDADAELESAASVYYSVAKEAMAAGREKLATHSSMLGDTPPVLSPFSSRGHVQLALGAPSHLTSPAAAQLGATPSAPSTPARAPGAARGTPQSAAAVVQATPPSMPAAAAAAAAGDSQSALTLAQLLGREPLPASHLPDSAEVQRRSAALDISAARMAAKRQAIRRASRVAAMAADSLLARNSKHALAASLLRRSGQAEGSRYLSGAVLFEQAALALLAANTATPATIGIGSALATRPLPTPQVRKHAFHAVLAAQAYAGNSPPAPYHALRALAASRVSYTPHPCSWPEVDALTIQDMAKSLRAMGDYAAASNTFATALTQTAATTSEGTQVDMLHELCAAFVQWGETHQAASKGGPPCLAAPGLPQVHVPSLQVVSWDNAATAWACLHAVASLPAEAFPQEAPQLPQAPVQLPWCTDSLTHAAHLGLHSGAWQGCRAGEGPPRRIRDPGVGAAGLNPGAKVPPHLLDDSGHAWPVWSLLRAQMYASAQQAQAPAPGRAARVGAAATPEGRLTQAANAAEDAWEALMAESRASGDSAMHLLAPGASSTDKHTRRQQHLEADVTSVSSRGVGQPFAVLLTLSNPLRIPLHLTDLHLTSAIDGATQDAAPPAQASTLLSGLTWVAQPGCMVSSCSIVLPPMGRCRVPLIVVPTSPDCVVTMAGLLWKLGGVALCEQRLEVPGPRLTGTTMQRARGMHALDKRLAFSTLARHGWLSALLHVPAWEGPSGASCLSGEVMQGTLRVDNCGTSAVSSLCMCTHGEGALWLLPVQAGVRSVANAGGVQHHLALPEGGLAPGASVAIPVVLRAAGCAGQFRLAVLLHGEDGSEQPVTARWGTQVHVQPVATADIMLRQSAQGSQAVVRVAHAADAGVPHTQVLAVGALGQGGCSLRRLGAPQDAAPLMRVRVGGSTVAVFAIEHTSSEGGSDADTCWAGDPAPLQGEAAGDQSAPLWRRLAAVAAVTQLGERRLAAARLHEHQKRTSAEAADHLPPTLRSIRLAAGSAGGKGAAPQGMKDGAVLGHLQHMLQYDAHPQTAEGSGCALWVVLVRWQDRLGMLVCGPVPRVQPPSQEQQWLVAECNARVADAPLVREAESALWHRLAYFAPHRSLPVASKWPCNVQSKATGASSQKPETLRIHSRTTDQDCLRRMFAVQMHTAKSAVASSLALDYRRDPAARALKPQLMSQLDTVLTHLAPPAKLNNSADLSVLPSEAQQLAALSNAEMAVQVQATGLALGKLCALVPITVHMHFNAVPATRGVAWSEVQAVAPEVLLLPLTQQEGVGDSTLQLHWLSPQRQVLPVLVQGMSARVQLWVAAVCDDDTPLKREALSARIASNSIRVKLKPAQLQGTPPPVAAVEVGPFADQMVAICTAR